MSEIENLELIRKNGLKRFLLMENEKWISGGRILCVHDRRYYPEAKRHL
ncbi:MAG TPA: hypothetical protein VHE12_05425 [bacterium]|nr:hypothetical protein [bacterium]